MGYVLPEGHAVQDVSEIPEVAIVSFPLSPPEAPDWSFAVLQISTDDPRCMLKTANTALDVSVEKFSYAADQLTTDFEATLQRHT